MKKTPDWGDDKALLKLVEDELLKHEWWFDNIDDHSKSSFSVEELFGFVERNAIAAAKTGNFRPMVDMRTGRNPLIRKLLDGGNFKLSEEAERLINERLLGERRIKKGLGAPSHSIQERRESPTFCAAQDVPHIVRILQEHFSGRRRYKVRAQELAAKRWNLKDTDLLVSFMRKGRHKYHRSPLNPN